jgi:hypothetical protein
MGKSVMFAHLALRHAVYGAIAQVDVLWRKLLAEPLQSLNSRNPNACEAPIVLMTDAMDEAENPSQQLPSRVHIALSSRPEMPILQLSTHHPHQLACSCEESMAYLKTFIGARLHQVLMLEADAARIAELTSRILVRSNGLFLHAHFLLESLVDAKQAIEWLEQEEQVGVPTGLDAFYRSTMQRLFASEADFAAQARPVLQVVWASRENLALSTLARALNRSKEEVAGVL